jgi:hypothetical protein
LACAAVTLDSTKNDRVLYVVTGIDNGVSMGVHRYKSRPYFKIRNGDIVGIVKRIVLCHIQFKITYTIDILVTMHQDIVCLFSLRKNNKTFGGGMVSAGGLQEAMSTRIVVGTKRIGKGGKSSQQLMPRKTDTDASNPSSLEQAAMSIGFPLPSKRYQSPGLPTSTRQ